MKKELEIGNWVVSIYDSAKKFKIIDWKDPEHKMMILEGRDGAHHIGNYILTEDN